MNTKIASNIPCIYYIQATHCLLLRGVCGVLISFMHDSYEEMNEEKRRSSTTPIYTFPNNITMYILQKKSVSVMLMGIPHANEREHSLLFVFSECFSIHRGTYTIHTQQS